MHCSRWRRASTLGWYSRVTKVGTKRLKHGLVKQTQFCVIFIAPWWRNGSFQRTQSFQFLNRTLFGSSLVVMNLRWRLKEYCEKNKRQRWDICEEFSVWHFVTKRTGLKSVKPRMLSHLSEWRDPSNVSLAMCPECPRKNDELSPSVYCLHPRESGPKFVQGPGGVTTSPTLLDSVLVWSYQNYLSLRLIAGISGPLRAAASTALPKGKVSTKMSKWMSVEAYNQSFHLWNCLCFFAKSECRIQISKHIWMETCVFVNMHQNVSYVEGKMVLTP